jgi:hypothetical protein
MKFVLLIILTVLLIFHTSYSDQRTMVWTYEYSTMEPGNAEMEHYTTFSSISKKEMKDNTTTELNYEVEVGMTKRFDFGIYQTFSQAPKESFKYSGYKLRARYKLLDSGEFFVNPLIYLEYKGVPDFSHHEIEGKLVLDKEFGKFKVSVNPYFEYETGEEESEFILKYSLGIRYQLGKLLYLGIESMGSKDGNYIGPTIAHGNSNFWFALGSLYSIGKVETGKPEFQLRMILGLHL